MVTLGLQAVILFFLTNLDDIIVLALFFARGQSDTKTTRKIIYGQYLGFSTALLISVGLAWGAQAVLPASALPYFGLFPICLGLYVAWVSWNERFERRDSEDDYHPPHKIRVISVALVALANGANNVAIYVPVFIASGPEITLAYSLIFLALVPSIIYSAKFLATRGVVSRFLMRWEHILFPIVLIALGVFILIDGGAFA